MTDRDPITDPARPGCDPAQAALQRLLDGEANWDCSEAAAHRAACVDCREELALARRLRGAVAQPAFPSELTNRVVGAAVTQYRRGRMVRYAGLGAALAASILVAAVVFQPSRQTITETRSVASLPLPKDGAAPSKPLGDAVSDARDALVSLTRRTANETRATSVALVPDPKLPNVPDSGVGLEPLADAQVAAARSVEPIKTSARRALNLFLRAADPPNKPTVQ
jgi:predicted anti-sigma-YlaC factor YlaD